MSVFNPEIIFDLLNSMCYWVMYFFVKLSVLNPDLLFNHQNIHKMNMHTSMICHALNYV